MRTLNPNCPNFLDKKDNEFLSLHGAMDVVFHQLHSAGVGRDTKHARTLSIEDEQKLWQSGVMGTTTPAALQNATFFIVGKMFCLRGGTELRNLKPSQMKRLNDPNRYVYTEYTSKTQPGSFKKLYIKNKVVPIFECPEVGEQCPVLILDKYFSKLPPEAFSNDIFFLRPIERHEDSKHWYSKMPVGRNILDIKLSGMCKMANIEGKISNHSLRATSATTMFQMGVPEKIIQEHTGHRSLEALRTYERANEDQHRAASKVLCASTDIPYEVSHQQEHSTASTDKKYNVSCCRQTSHKSLNIQSLTPSSSTPFIFKDFHGCTINFYSAPAASVTASNNQYDMTEFVMEQFMSD